MRRLHIVLALLALTGCGPGPTQGQGLLPEDTGSDTAGDAGGEADGDTFTEDPCQKVCKQSGRCFFSGWDGKDPECKVASNDDCINSQGCRDYGKCDRVSGCLWGGASCQATLQNPGACLNSTACRKYKHCIPTAPSDTSTSKCGKLTVATCM